MDKYIEYTLRSIINILFPLNQKDSFWIAKGLVLGSKRIRFEQQKESFCKAKGLHFYPKSESREIQIKTCHIM